MGDIYQEFYDRAARGTLNRGVTNSSFDSGISKVPSTKNSAIDNIPDNSLLVLKINQIIASKNPRLKIMARDWFNKTLNKSPILQTHFGLTDRLFFLRYYFESYFEFSETKYSEKQLIDEVIKEELKYELEHGIKKEVFQELSKTIKKERKNSKIVDPVFQILISLVNSGFSQEEFKKIIKSRTKELLNAVNQLEMELLELEEKAQADIGEWITSSLGDRIKLVLLGTDLPDSKQIEINIKPANQILSRIDSILILANKSYEKNDLDTAYRLNAMASSFLKEVVEMIGFANDALVVPIRKLIKRLEWVKKISFLAWDIYSVGKFGMLKTFLFGTFRSVWEEGVYVYHGLEDKKTFLNNISHQISLNLIQITVGRFSNIFSKMLPSGITLSKEILTFATNNFLNSFVITIDNIAAKSQSQDDFFYNLYKNFTDVDVWLPNIASQAFTPAFFDSLPIKAGTSGKIDVPNAPKKSPAPDLETIPSKKIVNSRFLQKGLLLGGITMGSSPATADTLNNKPTIVETNRGATSEPISNTKILEVSRGMTTDTLSNAKVSESTVASEIASQNKIRGTGYSRSIDDRMTKTQKRSSSISIIEEDLIPAFSVNNLNNNKQQKTPIQIPEKIPKVVRRRRRKRSGEIRLLESSTAFEYFEALGMRKTPVFSERQMQVEWCKFQVKVSGVNYEYSIRYKEKLWEHPTFYLAIAN